MSRRWSRFAPLSGVVFVVLFAIGAMLSGSEPNAHASTAKVLSYFGTNVTRHNVSYYLSALAVVVGLFFYANLCEHLREDERSPRLARAAFAGAIVFAAAGVMGIGTDLTLTNAPTGISASTAQALSLLGNFLSAPAMAVGVVLLLVSAGVAILHGRSLPSWSGWLAVGLGIVTLIPIPNLGVLPAGLWTVIVSVILFRRPAPIAGRSGQALSSAATGISS